VTSAFSEVGVHGLGVHLPVWAVDRSDLAASWGVAAGRGRRSVASYDEDVVTMAVSAGQQALADARLPLDDVDIVLFVTTTPVYIEGQHAPLIAAALGLSPRLCLDLGASLRGAIDAITLGTALIRGGAARAILVTAADRRDLAPGSAHEQRSGDAAAAVVLRPDPGLLVVEAGHAEYEPAQSLWRLAGEPTTSIGDDRFVTRELLEPWLTRAVAAARSEVSDPATTAVLVAPLPRAAASVARAGGLAPPISSPVDDEIGFTGVAAALLELPFKLAGAHAGQRVVVGAAGDGASAFVARVVAPDRLASIAAALTSRIKARKPASAGLFQRLRGQLSTGRIDPSTSEVLLHRESAASLSLLGSRCTECSALDFPPRRVCQHCGAADRYDREALPRAGVLYTFTTEYLFPVPTNTLVMGVVDLGEARFYTQVADADPEECQLGAPVSLVLRRLHNGGGIPHYFWKAQLEGHHNDART
jgi:hydroxymethylglutaryl-CoA synthase